MTSACNTTATAAEGGAWAPFKIRIFAVLWVATVLSNIGTWMHDVGAGWLMTELAPSPFMVASVQAASTLPIFLFALPAGAIADIVDRRRLLIAVNLMMAITAGALAVLVWVQLMTPVLLLIFTFLLGSGAAFIAPAWQSIVPQLVPAQNLSSAIALNSMGINISRAIGPAVAGALIVGVGLFAPFALNAISFLGIIAALVWWRPAARPESKMPPEHLSAAIVAGLRYAINSGPLRATLLRAVGFFVFASAYWAMLPLIAKSVLGGGAALYGILLGAVGTGAVIGAVMLPKIRAILGPDRTVAAGTVGTALAMATLALVPVQGVAVAAGALGGVAWIAVLSSINVSVQTALPNWVRARGLSIFLTVFFGAMSAGSLVWGKVATEFGVPTALLVAAAGAVLAILVTWRAKLNQGAGLDHAPARHWPEPMLSDIDIGVDDAGPVMIRITYQIAPPDQPRFHEWMAELRQARQRHGAYAWTLMQDTTDPSQFVETWFEASWQQHLRHHDRVTGADKVLQDRIAEIHQGGGRPKVAHHLAPMPGNAGDKS